MPQSKFSTLLGLVGSDEEDLDVLGGRNLAPATNSRKMAPVRKGRVTASKTARTATRIAAKADIAETGALGREPLAEKPANISEKATRGKGRKRPATDDPPTLEAEDLEESSLNSEAKPKAGRGRPKAAKTQQLAEEDDELTGIQIEAPAQTAAKRGRKPKVKTAIPLPEPEISETQAAELEIPETQLVEHLDLGTDRDEPVEESRSYSRLGPSTIQHTQPHVSRSPARRPLATSALGPELHDPLMRRRIGELTRKYENLEAKYRDLREIGVKEAERNYDRLRKQGEEKARTSDGLISALKAQLSTQTELAKESQRLRQQLEASEAKAEELESKIGSMNSSLSEAKTEVKALSTKLAATRSAEASSVKIPGSAVKGNKDSRLIANAAEAAAQVATAKENLYGDLTGLLVCGVKREAEEEVFDCVQTGRNGTLHFKLVVDGSADKFDDVQFMYMPQLDADRDEDLMDVLPDYLVEEISFPRLHAAKFYARVMKALNERPE
ncbi:chromosome segregation protein Csm1/Pcs1-domain-containing protein [Xylariaceae sp. FL0016]|nr:chromosome segregation protein Csm1/Pcs1-domain-containing protein [Xylariaceae sp. FL0016]